MPIYHCFYVGFDNKVVETLSMKSPSATAMLEEAERLLGSNSTVAGIEIWKGGRLDRKVWLKRSARIEGELLTRALNHRHLPSCGPLRTGLPSDECWSGAMAAPTKVIVVRK